MMMASDCTSRLGSSVARAQSFTIDGMFKRTISGITENDLDRCKSFIDNIDLCELISIGPLS